MQQPNPKNFCARSPPLGRLSCWQTLIAECLAKTALLDTAVVHALVEIGRVHLTSSFPIVLVRAIFAGWLIALMVCFFSELILPGLASSSF